MKFKTKGGKEYKIIPEHKVVVGREYKWEIENELDGIPEAHEDIILTAESLLAREPMWLYDAYVHAKAICDERDEYNEKIGTEVCGSKIDCKQHLRLAKRYARIYRLLSECLDYVYKKCEYHMSKVEAINNDLVSYYGRKY